MPEPGAALFFDGRSAVAHAVSVVFSPEGLMFSAGGTERRVWPYESLRIIDRSGGVRLACANEPDCRLFLSFDLADQLYRQAPHVFSPQRERRKTIVLVASLTGAAMAAGAILFLGAPIAAEPLARLTPPAAERTIGENVVSQLSVVFPACEGPETEAAYQAVRPLLARLYDEESETFALSFRFVSSPIANAMALPGGHVMATQGLLETLDHPDQFAAVLAHEIAHVKNRDSMTGLYRSAGLGILLDILTGGSGVGQQLALLAGQATALQYTRAQEAEADEDAMQMLEAAGLDPGALADAFERLRDKGAQEDSNGLGSIETPEWLSSHPDTARRIESSRRRSQPGRPPALSEAEWERVRSACPS